VMFKITEEILTKTWRRIYREKPLRKRGSDRGVDNITIEKFNKNAFIFIKDINRQLVGDFFKFQPLKKRQIPRKGKSPRIIQIPTVRDRLVQRVMAEFLNKQFSIIFKNNHIVGSVKGMRVERILRRALEYNMQGYKFVLKTDIINYFPTISKKRLSKIFFREVHDKKLRLLFTQYLKQSKEDGIPQGTPLSPFMSNLYLLKFDQVLNREKAIKHFRYVDDLVVFCKSDADAKRIYKLAIKLFRQVGLVIHPLGTVGKTYIDIFENGSIDILGVVNKHGRLLIKPQKYKEFIQETITPIQFKSCLNLENHQTINIALDNLLNNLNQRINGWVGAYRFCDMQKSLEILDNLMLVMFKRLLSKLDLPKADQIFFLRKLPKLVNAYKRN
jgi:retron-type reverse transcriptase